jgi:V-type H+-transporting ATPase subunit a
MNINASNPDFGGMQMNTINDDQRNPLIQGGERELRFAHVAGTIETSERQRMKKLLFRATKGTTLVVFSDFEQAHKDFSGKEVMKSAYFVTFQDVEHIRNRVMRICESFNGQRFDLPGPEQITQKLAEIKRSIQDAEALKKSSKKQLRTYLTQINTIGGDQNQLKEISQLEILKWYVAKEKALYHSLNMFKQGQSMFIGFFWSPTFEKPQIFDAMRSFKSTRCVEVHNHGIQPPSHFQSNEFTWAFQEIVNTYGIPTYKEVNPAVFACVSFPFLFGVMFGDVGHGSLLFLFGCFLVLKNDFVKTTPLAAMSQGRYLFFLMGFFAVFNGLCYNEFFALPLQANWGTCWENDNTAEQMKDDYYLSPKPDCVYPIGVDYSWGLSLNKLSFTNVMKMKISVILAIA